MQLFRTLIKVLPLPPSNQYGRAEFGWLVVWTLAASRPDANAKAENYVACSADFDVTCDWCVTVAEADLPCDREKFALQIAGAYESGVSSYAFWRPAPCPPDFGFDTVNGWPANLPGIPMPNSDTPDIEPPR